MEKNYSTYHKNPPLTEEEIQEKYNETEKELEEVLKWKKEEETNLKNLKASPQKISAAKRALKKANWRIDSVKGQIIYWKMRINGESHFRANLEKNEYWENCKNKK